MGSTKRARRLLNGLFHLEIGYSGVTLYPEQEERAADIILDIRLSGVGKLRIGGFVYVLMRDIARTLS